MLCDGTVSLEERTTHTSSYLAILYQRFCATQDPASQKNFLTALHYIVKGLLPQAEAPILNVFSDLLEAILETCIGGR